MPMEAFLFDPWYKLLADPWLAVWPSGLWAERGSSSRWFILISEGDLNQSMLYYL